MVNQTEAVRSNKIERIDTPTEPNGNTKRPSLFLEPVPIDSTGCLSIALWNDRSELHNVPFAIKYLWLDAKQQERCWLPRCSQLRYYLEAWYHLALWSLKRTSSSDPELRTQLLYLTAKVSAVLESFHKLTAK